MHLIGTGKTSQHQKRETASLILRLRASDVQSVSCVKKWEHIRKVMLANFERHLKSGYGL